MGVKKELKELAVALGASTTGLKTTGDFIEAIAKTQNPLAGLTIEPVTDTSTNLLGLGCSDLQSNVKVYNDRVSGHLKYVTEYTGFSGDTTEQEGNYLAIKASVPGETGVTITVAIGSNDPVTLDSDGILILRYTKAKGNKLTYVASKSTFSDFTKVIDLSDLTLAPKPQTV